MAKIKMRCGRCSRKFTASSAKQTFCPECEAKVRAERAAAKTASAKPTAGQPSAPSPKIVGPGASILIPGLSTSVADVPLGPDTVAFADRSHQSRETHGSPQRDGRRGDGSTQSSPEKHSAHADAETRTSRPTHDKAAHGERTPQPKSARLAREPRQPRSTPPAIVLSDELRGRIEQRYLELAQPVEFDGIRTQIAGELGIPKVLVKKAVADLRARAHMPSWWDMQTYTGGNNDLDRIRQTYQPHLPVPPIGVHKSIAEELGLDPSVVYQGIKRIRAEMRLPRFNPPELHVSETTPPDLQAATGDDPRVPVGAQAESVSDAPAEAR